MQESAMMKSAEGAIAGAAATIPMSWAMEVMHRLLPSHERQPLPPREITERVTEAAGVKDRLSDGQRLWLSLAAHVGYGAAVGALYQAVGPKAKVSPLLKGPAYGLAVWAGSYLGVLPALGIMKPATRHPARRTMTMVAAHLVWGSALALFADALHERSNGGDLQFLGSPRTSHRRGHPSERLHA
jgi:uncharacterized membrane protein YagU involved in acid resistance